MGNVSVTTVFGYIFVIAVALFILMSLLRLARSFYRWRKRMRSGQNDTEGVENQQDDDDI
jgi:biopolymer transport protein ExbB/TolQ